MWLGGRYKPQKTQRRNQEIHLVGVVTVSRVATRGSERQSPLQCCVWAGGGALVERMHTSSMSDFIGTGWNTQEQLQALLHKGLRAGVQNCMKFRGQQDL